MTSELVTSDLFPVPAPAVMSHRLLFEQEQFNLYFLISIILIIQIFLNWNVVSISVHRWIGQELIEFCKCGFFNFCFHFAFFDFYLFFILESLLLYDPSWQDAKQNRVMNLVCSLILHRQDAKQNRVMNLPTLLMFSVHVSP